MSDKAPTTFCEHCHAFDDESHEQSCPIHAADLLAEKMGYTKEPNSELVNHPPHYQANGMEAIDVIEAFNLGFRLGNAVKYILRAGRKGLPGKRTEDLRKALWYLEREIGGSK